MEFTFIGITLPAKASFETAIANAGKTLADTSAFADRVLVFDEENAKANLRNFEETATVIQATAVATSEENFLR